MRNDRTLFRNITRMAIAALTLLAVVQGVWVWQMYRDRVADFERRVWSAAYKSVYRSFLADAIPGLQAGNRVQIDLNDFALYFESNLLELNALKPYVLEVVSYLGDNGRVMMRRGDVDALEEPFVLQIEIDDEGYFLLLVYMDVPHAEFRREMSGLMLSSVGIVLLMAGLLFYLMRTWFRQKSLEEMRRDLTQNITHELKTPISVALAANDALRNFGADADAKRRSRYLEMVNEQLQGLGRLVERILRLAAEEPEEYQPEHIQLRTLLESCRREVPDKTKEVTYTIECPEELSLKADRLHIENILHTLVENSLNYSHHKVQITLRAKATKQGITIEVEDNGIGIENRHLDQIFKKFYRVPTGDVQNVRGSGLGLYYARRVVEGHGGKIEAQSRPGEGTRITIQLPQNE